jgi:hypothetical protein
MRRNLFGENLRHSRIGKREKNDVAAFDGGGGFENAQTLGSRATARSTSTMQANDYIEAAIAQIQCVRVPLHAETNDATDFPAQRVELDLLVAKDSHGAATMPAADAKFNS